MSERKSARPKNDAMYNSILKKCIAHHIQLLPEMIHSEKGHDAPLRKAYNDPIGKLKRTILGREIGWGPSMCDTWLYMFTTRLDTAYLPLLYMPPHHKLLFRPFFRYFIIQQKWGSRGSISFEDIKDIYGPDFKQCYSAAQMHVLYQRITMALHTEACQFIVAPLAMDDDEGGGHANALVIDKHRRTIEHFDSNGSFFMDHALDFGKEMEQMLKKNVPALQGFKFMNVKDLVGRLGPQFYEGYGFLYANLSDRGGYCEIWAVLYAALRVANPEKSPHQIIDFLKDELSLREKKALMHRVTGFFSRRAQEYRHCLDDKEA